jgi:hypothetical protein
MCPSLPPERVFQLDVRLVYHTTRFPLHACSRLLILFVKWYLVLQVEHFTVLLTYCIMAPCVCSHSDWRQHSGCRFRSWMCSERTKRYIQTQLHRFESLKIDTHKVNHLKGILQSHMYSCIHTQTHTHTHTHTLSLSLSLTQTPGLVAQWFVYSLEGWGFQFISRERTR